MTVATMTARLRSLLDEVSKGFWDNDLDLYPALSNGQREYASIILAQYLARLEKNIDEPVPLTLIPLYKNTIGTVGSGVSSFTKPTGLAFDLGLQLTSGITKFNARKRDINPTMFFKQSNPYLIPNLGYYSLDASNVNIERGSIAGSLTYNFGYLTVLKEISSVNQPTLPEFTHTAIIQYALGEALLKAKMRDEANMAFNKFLQLVQYR